ncbi:MAG: DUF3108 domain-containing protein [Bdellovibrio sp.]|nr:DUF3108 domain-containing protein [Bdellovibrio sp.]
MDVGAPSLEGFLVGKTAILGCFIAISFLTSCSTSFLKYEKEDQLQKIDEFDKAVKIEQPATPPPAAPAPGETAPPTAPVVAKPEPVKTKTLIKDVKKTAKPTPAPKKGKKAEAVAVAAPTRRPPEIEDDAGFNGRRPLVDPFQVGEEVVHDVTYFKMSAGELRFKVFPFVKVNDRPAYKLGMAIKTVSLFNSVYSVEDNVDIFMDYESLIPTVFELHVKESGQLRESKMFFDNEKHTATFWDRKVTKEDGVEEKKQHWDIPAYAQNVYSSVFYMRMFKWEVGKEYSFVVANDKENLVFSGKALRKEVLDTKLGPMKAIVVQPNITLKGKYKSIGENLIWLSDDEHKYILRIEAKIKIGTLVSQVVSITPGKPSTP